LIIWYDREEWVSTEHDLMASDYWSGGGGEEEERRRRRTRRSHTAKRGPNSFPYIKQLYLTH